MGDLLQVRVSKAASGAVDRHAWPAADALDSRQVRRKHMLGMRHLGRRFCDSGWRFAHTGPVFTGAFSVTAATR